MSFVYVQQVVETNLVAFDCHWILINEVGVVDPELIFVKLSWDYVFQLQMDTFSAAPGFWRREQSLQSFGFIYLGNIYNTKPKANINITKNDKVLSSWIRQISGR